LEVVEDLAEAHGVKPDPCSFAACWSFYKNKIVAGEEGGAVAFKDKGDADKARQLRSLGFTDAHDFDHVPRGHNYRMSNVHAELILDSLHLVNTNRAERHVIERWHDEAVPAEWKMPPRDEAWVYDVRVPNSIAAIKELNANGIMARHAFKPMSQQAEFKTDRVPGARAWLASREVIYLPIHQMMSKGDVVKAIRVLSRVP
jgi:perosamine synthetase